MHDHFFEPLHRRYVSILNAYELIDKCNFCEVTRIRYTIYKEREKRYEHLFDKYPPIQENETNE